GGGAPGWELVWLPDPTGWGTTWVLQLLRVDAQTDSVSTVTLGRQRPQAGHAYETIASRDFASGALSVLVRDLTDGSVVATGAFAVPHAAGLGNIGAGFSTRNPIAPGDDGPVLVAALQ